MYVRNPVVFVFRENSNNSPTTVERERNGRIYVKRQYVSGGDLGRRCQTRRMYGIHKFINQGVSVFEASREAK
jgi:hypothetical protein